MTAARVLEMDLERGLPASIDGERAILGAILLDNQKWHEAAQSLAAEDFYLDAHRRLYRRMSSMVAKLIPIDLVTLVEDLRQDGELKAIGDEAFIAGLIDGVPERPSIQHYVRIVREKAQLRGLIFGSEAAIARAMDSEASTEIAGSLLKTVLDVESRAQMNHALSPRDFMPEVMRELEAEANSDGVVGLPTGIDDLDLMTGGLRKGELIVI